MKARYSIFVLFTLFLTLFSCIDESEEFQRPAYNPDDYPNPLEKSPYHIEDYHLLKSTLNIPEIPYVYTLKLPPHVLEDPYREIEIDRNQATLGRVLFFDKDLSRDNNISCASCHRPELAFSDNKKLSMGFRGEETHRNSLALGSTTSNAAYFETHGIFGLGFMWDFTQESVADVSRLALTSNIEMGMTMDEVLKRVQSKGYYTTLVKAAFGDEDITEERLFTSLESFVLSIGSYESRFDEGIIAANGEMELPFSSFTASENRGKQLYIEHCGVCHGTKLSNPLSYANNGLETQYTDTGIGFRSIPNGFMDPGQAFKIPGLRNIALTAPYMHDGRIETLKEVVEFYNSGIQDHEDLARLLRGENRNPIRLNLTELDKQALLDFLHTLTDEKFLGYDKYKDPFKL